MISYLMSLARMYMKDEKGQGMVEYILIIVFVALVVVLAFPTLTNAISAAFTNAAGKINPAGGGL